MLQGMDITQRQTRLGFFEKQGQAGQGRAGLGRRVTKLEVTHFRAD